MFIISGIGNFASGRKRKFAMSLTLAVETRQNLSVVSETNNIN